MLDWFQMRLQLTFRKKHFATSHERTLKIMLSFLSIIRSYLVTYMALDMGPQVSWFAETLFTQCTFEWLFQSVLPDMSFQYAFSMESLLANIALKLSIIFMYHIFMIFQVPLSSEFLLTHSTFEILNSQMGIFVLL